MHHSGKLLIWSHKAGNPGHNTCLCIEYICQLFIKQFNTSDRTLLTFKMYSFRQISTQHCFFFFTAIWMPSMQFTSSDMRVFLIKTILFCHFLFSLGLCKWPFPPSVSFLVPSISLTQLYIWYQKPRVLVIKLKSWPFYCPRLKTLVGIDGLTMFSLQQMDLDIFRNTRWISMSVFIEFLFHHPFRQTVICFIGFVQFGNLVCDIIWLL